MQQEIAKRIGSLVGKEQKGQIIAQMTSLYEESFSGPIPHPQHLAEYDNILPGSADRILTMAEENLSHNQTCQKSALDADIMDMRHSRRYGFGALVLLLGCAIFCAYLDKDILAGLFLGAGALGTISVLVRGNSK